MARDLEEKRLAERRKGDVLLEQEELTFCTLRRYDVWSAFSIHLEAVSSYLRVVDSV